MNSPISNLSPKPSKHEKKRFSFLNRGTKPDPLQPAAKEQGRPRISVEAPPASAKANGTPTANVEESHHIVDHATNPSRSEDKLQKYFGIPHSQYRVLSPDSERERIRSHPTQPVGNMNSGIGAIQHAGLDIERPDTRQSAQSQQSTDTSLGSKVGSVKKRLSMLGIGKKPSKSSVRSRGRVESLAEE